MDGDEIWVIETQKVSGTVVNFVEQNIRICEPIRPFINIGTIRYWNITILPSTGIWHNIGKYCRYLDTTIIEGIKNLYWPPHYLFFSERGTGTKSSPAFR